MRRFWQKTQPSRTVYVGSYEDKLSRLSSMRIDPDDDGRTREDREAERAARRPLGGSGAQGVMRCW